MIPPTRRRFIQQAAGSLTALCVYPFAAGSDDSNTPAAADGSIPSLDPAAVRSFAGQIDGHLVTPYTPDYESARLIFNRAFNRHPALILYCASASDFARGLKLLNAEICRLRCVVEGITAPASARALTA
jgi:hypothetical protein